MDDPTNPDGLCVAISRGIFPDGQTPADGPPTSISLFGVICQGFSAGHACFWDSSNISPIATMKFGGRTDTDQEHFVGGIDHEDPCTHCHRGDNIFISFNSSFPDPSPFPDDLISAILGIHRQTSNMDPIAGEDWDFVYNEDRFEFQAATGCPNCHHLVTLTRSAIETLSLPLGEAGASRASRNCSLSSMRLA